RLFGQARLSRALSEGGLHLRERDAARHEYDQQMVDEVGGFRDQARAILLDRGQNGLDRLLAQFLGAMAHALVEEPARIGYVGTCFGALLHTFLEIIKSKIGHRLSPPSIATSSAVPNSHHPNSRGNA